MINVLKIHTRPNISNELANTLRDMIFDGKLQPGERLNEVHLAASLGVSRTPLREALSMLVAEEALDTIPRRGFFVRELTREEFEDIYPIRGLLDPEALRLSGMPDKEGFQRLGRINEKMRVEKNMKKRVTLDDQWHLELISNCQNEVLVGLIKLFMRRFRRYGLAFFRERKILETANREHIEIMKALKAGEMDEACKYLKQNLSSNKEPILQWLDERQN